MITGGGAMGSASNQNIVRVLFDFFADSRKELVGDIQRALIQGNPQRK